MPAPSPLQLLADRLDPPEPVYLGEDISLPDFIPAAWHVLEPDNKFLSNWHIDLIAEHLEAVSAGEIRRLIVNIPPRYMKSLCVSVFWPAWSWIARPGMRWMFASYAEKLATKHSVDRRTLIQSPWYQSRYGDRFAMTSDQNVKTEFMNDHRGHMISTSFGGTATGKGGDVVVIDDPHNPEQALSDQQRATALRRFDQTLSTRLDNKMTGRIVVVMQRLHENDLTGHILATDDEYVHVKLPAEAPAHTVVSFPRSDRDVVREEGELLWPEREGPPEIAKAKVRLGSYAFSGQYQQEPSPLEGGMLKRTWWRFWRPRHLENLPPIWIKTADGIVEAQVIVLPDGLSDHLQSWDMAFKDKKDSDFVVGQSWARKGADKFLLDQVRDQMDFPSTLDAFRAFTVTHPETVAKLVEDKANGPAVIATLKHEIAGIIEVEPQGGKEARVAAVSPVIEAGNVYLPHPAIAPWVTEFVEEAATFPNAAHDDMVDTMSQALLRLATPLTSTEAEYFRRGQVYED